MNKVIIMCSQMKLNEKDILYLKNNFNIHFDIPFQTIKPSEFALVLYKEKEIRSKLLRFGWNEKHLIINARQETLLDKKLFKHAKRCLIPVSTFYEWNPAKNKISFYSDHILYLAGLINNKNEFLIITTNANDSVKKVHNRMPLIIEESDIENWFDDHLFKDLLHKIAGSLMHDQKLEQLSLF